ncbi:FABP family protein [Corynebacterium choanae]|uniref:Ferric nitrobindin-like protein n=1 Tax=Corynebacterium choanae TaxID=1862358 RepID=A0A3G6J9W9_9CORY|nr:FABP family protein [Corynebacterium choanae]AZA12824.1 hypothetical protein CCHOA_01985 [Corynebacterium choanae]
MSENDTNPQHSEEATGATAADAATTTGPVVDTAADAQAAAPQSPFLSGSAAVNLAAEQSKITAEKNIPNLEGLPVADDTANLRQGPNLHDGLLALLPLIGVWEGQGQADTAEGGSYPFGQRLTFAHNGENYISYSSKIYKLDEHGEAIGWAEQEAGFLRISESDEMEFVITHAAGAVEIFYGDPLNERAWQFETASTMVTATGPKALGPGKRLYGLMPNNDLGWVDERVVDGELLPRMSAQLRRIVG